MSPSYSEGCSLPAQEDPRPGLSPASATPSLPQPSPAMNKQKRAPQEGKARGGRGPCSAAEPGARCPGWHCWAGLVALVPRRARLGAQGQPGAVHPVLTHTICPGTQTLPAARGASGAPETEAVKVGDAVAPGALPGRGALRRTAPGCPLTWRREGPGVTGGTERMRVQRQEAAARPLAHQTQAPC